MRILERYNGKYRPCRRGDCIVMNTVNRYPGTKRGRFSRLILEERLGRKLRDGEVAMHTCDVTRCVNPSHIVLGTQALNNADTASKGHGPGCSPRPTKLVRRVRRMSEEMTQKEICRILKMPKSTVSQYVRGVRRTGGI